MSCNISPKIALQGGEVYLTAVVKSRLRQFVYVMITALSMRVLLRATLGYHSLSLITV